MALSKEHTWMTYHNHDPKSHQSFQCINPLQNSKLNGSFQQSKFIHRPSKRGQLSLPNTLTDTWPGSSLLPAGLPVPVVKALPLNFTSTLFSVCGTGTGIRKSCFCFASWAQPIKGMQGKERKRGEIYFLFTPCWPLTQHKRVVLICICFPDFWSGPYGVPWKIPILACLSWSEALTGRSLLQNPKCQPC